MSLLVRVIVEVSHVESQEQLIVTERGDTVVPIAGDPFGWLALVEAAIESGASAAVSSAKRAAQDLTQAAAEESRGASDH